MIKRFNTSYRIFHQIYHHLVISFLKTKLRRFYEKNEIVKTKIVIHLKKFSVGEPRNTRSFEIHHENQRSNKLYKHDFSEIGLHIFF